MLEAKGKETQELKAASARADTGGYQLAGRKCMFSFSLAFVFSKDDNHQTRRMILKEFKLKTGERMANYTPQLEINARPKTAAATS